VYAINAKKYTKHKSQMETLKDCAIYMQCEWVSSIHVTVIVKKHADISEGSVYFISNILAGTDRLELLCRQSKIWSHGMTQYHEKGHFVRKTPSCSWCNSYPSCVIMAAMPMVFSSTLSLPTFTVFFLCFFSGSA